MYISRKTIRLSESNRRPCHFSSLTIFSTHHFPTPLPTPNTHTHTHTHTLSLSRHGAMFQLQRETHLQSFPGAVVVKNPPAKQEMRVPSVDWEEGGNGNPLQYPCLENPMDRGAWWATVHGVAKSRTRLSG